MTAAPLRLLVFSRAAGGAAALVPALQALSASAEIQVLAKDHALSVFQRAGWRPIDFPACEDTALQAISWRGQEAQWPEALLTSAASLPHLDMTEKHLWQWAKRLRIPSVAVLDQWHNYALRFSGPTPAERLSYVPDWIAAMDVRACDGLIAAGLSPERIVVTGQPAFDRLAGIRASWTNQETLQIRRQLGVAPGAALICFVSESFADAFGHTLGYTEQTVLRELLPVCARLVAALGRAVHLLVKLHPENDPQAFTWLEASGGPDGLQVTRGASEVPALDVVMASDAVVGMTSVLLIESIILGRPTVSFQPNTKQSDGLMATVAGAIPLLDTAAVCETTLRGVLGDAVFRATYLDRQAILKADGNAGARVAALVRRAAEKLVMVS